MPRFAVASRKKGVLNFLRFNKLSIINLWKYSVQLRAQTNAWFPLLRNYSATHRTAPQAFSGSTNTLQKVGNATACGSQRRVAGAPQAVLYFSQVPAALRSGALRRPNDGNHA